MRTCAVCEGLLPEIAIRAGDPFCSRACADFSRGVGTGRQRERAMRLHREQQREEGLDRESLELRRVEVEERQRLLADGRFGEAWIAAFAAHRIAHAEPVAVPTTSWFSYRPGGPTMRTHEEPDRESRAEPS